MGNQGLSGVEGDRSHKISTIYSGFYTYGVAARRLGNGQASLSATLALRSSKTWEIKVILEQKAIEAIKFPRYTVD